MPWTPLHAALGETHNDLSIDLIERACAERVEERTDLEWKSALPLTETKDSGKEGQQNELAKDIAAMANSGGGMIVYGVDEQRGGDTSAAEKIRPVGEITDAILQTIRQVAGNLIYPPVMSLQLIPVAPGDRAAGVLVMLVPNSPDAPHLVHPGANAREWFVVPWRDGPYTRRMVERQIATAYQRREIARRQSAADLDHLYNSLARACVTGSSTWVLAVAQPDVPAGDDRRLTLHRADTLIRSTPFLRGLPGAISAITETEGATTRRGLRLFHRTASRYGSSVTLKGGGRLQLHGSGAVAVGSSRAGVAVGGAHEVSVIDIEQAGIDLFQLLLKSSRALGRVSRCEGGGWVIVGSCRVLGC